MDRNDTVQIVVVIVHVALRKESVDRNKNPVIGINKIPKSLSARRAWIEILDSDGAYIVESVALRKESVDRNYMGVTVLGIQHRRSPQGERG